MALRQYLIDLINAKGPISIEEFMQTVMTRSLNSYYIAKQPIGSEGDFVTAPEISQLFGEIIGIWAVLQWQKLHSPKKCYLIELGPGKGTLLNDLLRSTAHVPHFHESLEIHLVECNPHLRKLQAQISPSISWLNNLYEMQNNDAPFIIIANEFFDALPIKQYMKGKTDWKEIMVNMDTNRDFIFTERHLSDQEAQFLYLDYSHVQEGEIVEISLQANQLYKFICELLQYNSGAALVIDYGYFQAKSKYVSTLQAVKSHSYHPILQDLGEADLSAHVDFDQLANIIKIRDLQEWSLTTQREFLLYYGIDLRLKQLLSRSTPKQAETLMAGYERLLNPAKMGHLFKALHLFVSSHKPHRL